MWRQTSSPMTDGAKPSLDDEKNPNQVRIEYDALRHHHRARWCHCHEGFCGKGSEGNDGGRCGVIEATDD